MKKLVLLSIYLLIVTYSFSQSSFIDYQTKFPRVADALNRKADTLKKQFAAAGLQWPARQIYIRSFKYDSQLEVWVRNSSSEPFKLFKTYGVCALAGTMGPKRVDGDYQVPEGFYYINAFKPSFSNYQMALGLNYPNASDKIVTAGTNPGGGIYIHGSCITVGCIPLQDKIDEVYILAMCAKSNGQDFIPVHIFPIRYNNSKSVAYFEKTVKDEPNIQEFSSKIKPVYDYFEKEKKLPIISIDPKGGYEIMN